ncbi:streptophobe family protein [Streptomyces pharetrae]|uniref:streptophobe family protein n=1 Tax=Streptomyces pharetrae TaxID=291370 RepID=UPI00334C0342
MYSGRPVTLGRLAELDGRVWLPTVVAGLALLLAGVVQAARTPVDAPPGGRVRHPGAVGFAGRCALRLGVATALALPLSALLTEVSLNASLPVPGVDAFGAGPEMRAHLGMAVLLGAVWGAGAGAGPGGALLAGRAGAAGRRMAPPARGEVR